MSIHDVNNQVASVLARLVHGQHPELDVWWVLVKMINGQIAPPLAVFLILC